MDYNKYIFVDYNNIIEMQIKIRAQAEINCMGITGRAIWQQ